MFCFGNRYSRVLTTVPNPTPSCLLIWRMLAPCCGNSIARSRLKILFCRPMGRFFPERLWTVLPTLPALKILLVAQPVGLGPLPNQSGRRISPRESRRLRRTSQGGGSGTLTRRTPRGPETSPESGSEYSVSGARTTRCWYPCAWCCGKRESWRRPTGNRQCAK